MILSPVAPAPVERGAVGRHAVTRRPWGHVPGLDGVRAVAVFAVLVFHLGAGWLPGGFLGVDVFFTLSGFLITSLLLVELDASGRVRFGRFYQRRARRLLPALLLVLGATSVAALLVAQDAVERLRGDVLASLGYVTNWWYVAHGLSYFDATGRPPLLQHLWSLAVEEQFYLVWPVLMLGLWLLGRRAGVRVGAVVGALASTGLMAVWHAQAGGVDSSREYFGTDTHAMTLLAGATLATWWQPRQVCAALTRRGSRLATLVGVASMTGLLACFGLLSAQSPFLYRGGFLVVGLLAAGLVAAASLSSTVIGRVLGRQPLRYLGQRSYGIYLWHWPVFMLLRPGIDVDATGWPVTLARLTVTLMLAELSYRFVEMPIRNGALARAGARLRAGGPLPAFAASVVAVALSVALVGGLGVGLVRVHPVTLESALGGVTAIGDDVLPSPRIMPVVASRPATPRPPTTPRAAHTAGARSQADQRPTLARPVSVTAVGDSVLLAAATALQQAIPGVIIDAEVGRFPGAVFGRIRSRAAAGVLGDSVVIAAGTNGTIVQSDLHRLLGQLAGERRIVLVTDYADRSWIPGNNQILRAESRLFANVRLLDWNRLAPGHRDWLYADGIHPKGAGAAAYAAYVKQALAH